MTEKIKCVTRAGCQVELDPNITDDWEMLELMSSVDEDPTAVVDMFRRLLGDEQYKKVKENLREKEGRVSATSMSNELASIFESANSLKNS